MRIECLSTDEALRSAGRSRDGLSSAEAAARAAAHGPNRIERVARRPWPLRLLVEFTSLFSVILWIAAALVAIGEWFDPGRGMACVAVAIVVVIVAKVPEGLLPTLTLSLVLAAERLAARNVLVRDRDDRGGGGPRDLRPSPPARLAAPPH